MELSADVFAVHLVALEGPDTDDHRELRARWAAHVETPARAAGIAPPRLLVIRAEYRRMLEPLLELIRTMLDRYPDRWIAVVLPELIKTTWWQNLLHTHRARRLRGKLLHSGGSRVVVIDVPWYREEPNLDALIAEPAIHGG
jgi:hypothetical protein